jgi:REP element-mobilizing transposase RayT
MTRTWFFTWRTYGTWLPGDDGFVGYFRDSGKRKILNAPAEEFAPSMPALAKYARSLMPADAVQLTRAQAETVFVQMNETAAVRQWTIDAVAILPTHIHVVFRVPGDPDPSHLLRDWKSYASRALNRTHRRNDWWAERGSMRPIKTNRRWLAASVTSAINKTR